MASSRSIVTGDKELDAMLKKLPLKLQKKYMRKATRNAAKKVQQGWKDKVPVETGAARDAAKVRATKRSRNKVGSSVVIDREKMILERAARGGQIGQDAKRGEPYFYAADLEFDADGDKPLRSTLYNNQDDFRREVKSEVRHMIFDAEAEHAAQL